MIRQPVESSFIKSAGHDGENLEIEFASGTIAQIPVTPEEHAAFLAAESKGKHYNAMFRKRPHTRIEGS